MDILRATRLVGSFPDRGAAADGHAVLVWTARRLSRAVTGLLGLVWALTMGVGGGLMMLAASGAAPWLQTTLLWAGCTGVLAGVFVFQLLVADRLFPRADPGLVRNVEASFGVAIMVGLVLTLLTFLA